MSGPLILDGRTLAAERVGPLAAAATAVNRQRGHPPRVCLLAFVEQGGEPPYIGRKVRACAATGVDARPIVLPSDAATRDAVDVLETALATEPVDAVFVEFPFPSEVDGDVVVAAVPERLDVDVMTAGRTRRYLSDGEGPPPLTVAAGLALLDRFEVDISGLDGVVVGDPMPFTEMFRAALARRGARMRPVRPPDAPGLREEVATAGLVVAAAARPGLLNVRDLAAGTVAIDAGYYNPGGHGDIDCSDGAAHLAALAPVPGAIGPMTVSMLVERTIAFAESG